MKSEKALLAGPFRRVSEGTRTPDRLDHNQELYQLSYAHRGTAESTSAAYCCRNPTRITVAPARAGAPNTPL
jgi:hypothetical protein